ncbi:MAG TPA: NAD(P)/FAD-dependent oxidoreductase [Ferruginibacter sp.]|nr:NAD(P)/FAD-dependent oxidoreductase [Ferruginibacter sp.]HRO06424.1 NAD(P)/FAD-dependent oxidoreductase [Ferruginibacter sp.]HRO96488.1 NAD(P)/FAD-dependent oxidoreductase [Ferruginibacter sp.]HRP50101.1 NAD(P)/FAD-dependent oxidoreductase [Ferruginibacter sp.]
MKKVSIVGAGLVGSLLAIYLTRRQYKVTLFERRGDMRKVGVAAGRSINLALSDRGIRALREVGIMPEIEKIAIPMYGRQMHNKDGSSPFQPYGKENQCINSVSRGELNKALMTLAEQHGAQIVFNKPLQRIDFDERTLYFEDGSTETSDLIFGSDGAYAASRLSHQLQHNRFQYQQYYIDFGYKELHIPPGPNGSFQMEKNALHIWPRGNYMLIALPNPDGSFTCTLFFPFEGDPSFASLDTAEKARKFFNETFSDASSLMPTLEEDFMQNPTSSLVTVKCFPWVRNDHFALIGDAAHAIVPFFGQGMNCGFEDCAVLNELIDIHREDWNRILSAYQDLRKPDGDAIADLALANFVEMRDKVADPTFLLQKKIEAAFSARYPDLWTPAYSMVTFRTDLRYSEALHRGNHQESIMRKVMAMPDIESKWDSEEVQAFILQQISR